MAIAALAVFAPLGMKKAFVLEGEEVVDVGAALEVYVAAFTAVPPVGSTPGDMLFAAKCHTAISAGTRFDQDPGGVNEHE